MESDSNVYVYFKESFQVTPSYPGPIKALMCIYGEDLQVATGSPSSNSENTKLYLVYDAAAKYQDVTRFSKHYTLYATYLQYTLTD